MSTHCSTLLRLLFIESQRTRVVFNHIKSVMLGTFYHNMMYLIYYDN